jgi:hypothetical protein
MMSRGIGAIASVGANKTEMPVVTRDDDTSNRLLWDHHVLTIKGSWTIFVTTYLDPATCRIPISLKWMGSLAVKEHDADVIRFLVSIAAKTHALSVPVPVATAEAVSSESL